MEVQQDLLTSRRRSSSVIAFYRKGSIGMEPNLTRAVFVEFSLSLLGFLLLASLLFLWQPKHQANYASVVGINTEIAGSWQQN